MTQLVGRQEGHPACKKLGVSSNKIQNGDTLVPANPGPPGKMAIIMGDRDDNVYNITETQKKHFLRDVVMQTDFYRNSEIFDIGNSRLCCCDHFSQQLWFLQQTRSVSFLHRPPSLNRTHNLNWASQSVSRNHSGGQSCSNHLHFVTSRVSLTVDVAFSWVWFICTFWPLLVWGLFFWVWTLFNLYVMNISTKE